MKRLYIAFLPTSKHGYGFDTKKEAVAFARRMWVSRNLPGKVRSKRTGQVTHILHPERSSCSMCGNELEGKQHCPLCGALHSYR